MVSIDRGDHTKEGNGGGEDDHVNTRDGSIAGQYTRRPGFRLAGYVWTYPDLMKQLARRSKKGGDSRRRNGAYQEGGMKKEMPPMSMAAATTRLTIRLAGAG